MKKILCILLVFCMVACTGCSFGFLNLQKAEPVNKNMDNDNAIINPVSVGGQSASSSPVIIAAEIQNHKQAYDVAAGTLTVDAQERDLKETEDNDVRINDELIPPVLLAGIPHDTWVEDGYVPVILFYKDKDSYLVPITRKATNHKAVAKGALSLLIDSALIREELAPYNLYPVLPSGTKILDLNIVNGIAEVNFESGLTKLSSFEAERSAITSIVYTLTQFQTISGVRFKIDGQKLSKLKFGTDLSNVLYRANTLVNSDKINVQKGMEKTDIYLFRNSTDNIAYSLPVSYEHEPLANGEIFGKVVDLLAKAGTDGVASLLPQDVRLINSTVLKDTIVLNFSSQFRSYGGSTREEAILRQLEYTFSQYKGLSKIKILIEGQETVLPEGTDLKTAFQISRIKNLLID